MIHRIGRSVLFSLFVALMLSALVAGVLFFSHRDMVEKHLAFARELLLKDAIRRFDTLFEGYFYWDAMVYAAIKGNESFLENQFEDMREKYGVQELLFGKGDILLYRFGDSEIEESLFASLEPQALTFSLGKRDFSLIQKLPLVFEDGTLSKFHVLLRVANPNSLRSINAFLGTHLAVSRTPRGIPLTEGYFLQETGMAKSFFRDPVVRNLLLLSFLLMGAIVYGINIFISRRHSLESQLFTMSMVLEKRDSYTSHHSCKVADNARLIAKKLGLNSRRQDLLVKAGLLHDLGKLFVPDAILLKKGRLTPEEFDIIKQHPGDGADMVENILKRHFLARVIRGHHERWNGSGYPQGLSEHRILLESRILAVADVIDAMMSQRPYHGPRSPQEVREHLLEGRGTLYDPRVVDAALEIFPKKPPTTPNLPSKYASLFFLGKYV